ncbi:MAG: hypothetical protein O6849_00765 [Candidatus Dadabacteria bacterium]|nr:hypothetical protein [Candidatus Dadabacteria bacterium]
MNKLTLKEYFEAFRVRIALKIVLAGNICILINKIFHFDAGYFSLLFSFLILILFHGEALKVGSQAFLGCVVSGSVTLIITCLLIESKVPYVLVMAVWIFFVVALLVKYFLAMLISGVAATMIMYHSLYNSVSGATTLFENYLIQLLIAVVVCSALDGLIWPNRSRGSFQVTLRTVYEELSELFNSYTQEVIEDRKNHSGISTTLSTFSNLATYINRMQKEEWGENFPIDLYMKIVTFSRGIFIKIEVLEQFILKEHSFVKDEKVAHNLNQIFTIISKNFSVLAQSIGTKNVVNVEDKDLEDSISSLHELYTKMHEIEGMEDEYYEDLLAFGAMLSVLDDILNKIKRIAEAINIFHRDEYQKMLENRVTRTNKVKKMKARSFFSIDKQSSIVGIKTVVIFLLLMFGEVTIGLPGGSQVVFFAILFGVIPNLGQAYMKSKYGILGVFCGLVLSFLSLLLVDIAPHFLVVLSLYSLGTFMAAYVASSSKDISAAGLQAGLLFAFSIIITKGPAIDIHDPFTRFLALFSAVFIGLIVQHILWPMNPYKLLKQKISKSMDFSGRIISKLLMLDIKDSDKVDRMVLPLAASLPTSTSLLHDAEYIIRHDELHTEQFIHIIESIERMYADIETLKRTIYENMDSGLVHIYLNNMKPFYKRICRAFDEVSKQFNSGNDVKVEINSIIEGVKKHRTELRESGVWRSFQPVDIEQTVLIEASIDNLLESLSEISLAIGEINRAKRNSNTLLMTKEA